MKIKSFPILLLASLLFGGVLEVTLSGCRTRGADGYIEINDAEWSDLVSSARGVLLNAKRKIKKTGRTTSVLHSTAARQYVLDELPLYKVFYTDDLTGRVVFEWNIDDWSYRVEATGELNRDIESLQWRFSVKPPMLVQGPRAQLWDGPDPDELADYLDRLAAEEEAGGELPPEPRPTRLERELPNERMREIVIEGAIDDVQKLQ